jgi:hypothetical protein
MAVSLLSRRPASGRMYLGVVGPGTQDEVQSPEPQPRVWRAGLGVDSGVQALTTLATRALSFLPLTQTRSHPLRFASKCAFQYNLATFLVTSRTATGVVGPGTQDEVQSPEPQPRVWSALSFLPLTQTRSHPLRFASKCAFQYNGGRPDRSHCSARDDRAWEGRDD